MTTKLDTTISQRLYEEAHAYIPGGVAGIRRPYNFVPGEYPIFIEKGQGGFIWDVDGNRYMDMLCSYGPIILGHREQEVDDAVIRQIRDAGFCFNLAQRWQNKLAEKLCELIPCAEKVCLVKTGSDATTTAIRIARGYTGRAVILRCGYHGWHDWCVEVKGGIPAKLYEDIHEFHYGDLPGLEALLQQYAGQVAGVIVTPVGHPLAHPVMAPPPGFLDGVRKLADAHGAVLIFDEIRSGFRVALGGAQQRYGVTPDVSCFGKAMANGYPISVVVGVDRVMKVLEKEVFISSTFFPNSLEMVAALATLELMQREHVVEDIWRKGALLLEGWRQAVASASVGAEVSGIPPMPFITFAATPDGRHKQRRSVFFGELIRRGVFLAPYHHGYVCWRHSDSDIQYAIDATAAALGAVAETVG